MPPFILFFTIAFVCLLWKPRKSVSPPQYLELFQEYSILQMTMSINAIQLNLVCHHHTHNFGSYVRAYNFYLQF